MTKTRDTHGGSSGRRRIPAAAISTDAEFRESLRAILAEGGSGVTLAVEVRAPFTEIADPQLEELRRAKPGVVFLDLESDPHVGLKFAQFLLDSGIGQALIGAGSTLSPELLLSAMQAGVSEYLPKPITAEAVTGALERVWRKMGTKLEAAPRQEPGKLLPIFSAKGGSGCTSLAVNLAIELHRLTRRKTLLVDLDLELGETALLLGMEPRFSIADLMRNFHRVDSSLLASYIERHASGVELLSAPYQPSDVEAVSGERVHAVLDFLRRHYDYVVVDSPKTFNAATEAAFRESDRLLIVTTADLPSLRNLTRSLPLLKRSGSRKGDDWLQVIVNRYEPKHVISLGEVHKTLELPVYHTIRNDYQTVMGSINAGKPAVLDAKSYYARDVRALAAKITGVQVSKPSKGLLGGLLSPFRGNGRERRAPATATAPRGRGVTPKAFKVNADE